MTVTERLAKTRNSINAHVARGGFLGSMRGQELVDRYNDLKESLVAVGGHKNPTWVAYCEAFGSSVAHDGYDLFA